MQIDVIHSAKHIAEYDITGKTVVVFDILRATSTIVTALEQGCRFVLPALTPEEAMDTAQNPPLGVKPSEVLLAGERGGKKIDGFPHGNSPLEYEQAKVKDRVIVLTTSNGTRAIRGSQGAANVFIGSLLNARSTALAALATGLDITLVCAGTRNKYSLEDTLAAGFIALYVMEAPGQGSHREYQLTDAANAAVLLARNYQEKPLEALYASLHGQKLLNLGCRQDLIYCSGLNTLNIVCRYSQGIVKAD